MKFTFKGLLPLIIFLSLGAALALGLTKDPRLMPSQIIDQPFPEFSLTDLYAPDIVLTKSDLTGQVTLVNVFGSWCVSCNVEHPKLMQIARSGSVDIWGIDWRDEREKGKNWLAARGNPFSRVIFDPDSVLSIDLGVTGAPESFIIDKNGQIRYKHVGIITDDIWDDILWPIITSLKAEG